MKNKIIYLIFAVFMIFALSCRTGENTTVAAGDTTSEILIEQSTKRVLYSSRERERRGIASTTKILTALCVLERCDLKKRVTITNEMVGIEGSSIYLKVGDVRTVEQLLYGLMLRSGNDAAVALALTVANSITDFARIMNETAISCGAKDSNFTNPHGLDDDGHYSTALDMALITARAFENEDFCKIVDSESYTFKTDEGETVVFINKNKLLKKDESFNGVKTGYTKKCGRCLVSAKKENGMQLILVVLNCGPMFERSEELLRSGAEKYRMRKILDKTCSYATVETNGGKMPALGASVESDVFYPLTEEEFNSLGYEFVPAKTVYKTDDIGEYAGKINVFLKKDLIYSAESFIIIPH